MKRISLGLIFVIICALPSWVAAYSLLGPKWTQPNATFYVSLPETAGIFNAGFETAIARWNSATPYFHYSVVRSFYDPCSEPSSGTIRNGAKFDSTLCGEPFGSSTVAVTYIWVSDDDTDIVQTGVIFNSTKVWDIYSGPYQLGSHAGVQDFVRVAVHELGHALGLDHETSLPSIMLPTINLGNTIEIPQQDDKNGVAALYGPADTIAPTVTITSPTSAPTYSTAGGSIYLGGTGTDNVAVTSINWASNRGSGLSGSCTFSGVGEVSWTCSLIPLFAGFNTLTVTARDVGGNLGAAVITVTRATVDTQRPSLTITSPTSTSTFAYSSNVLGLSGSGTDNVGVTTVTWVSDRGGSGNCAFIGSTSISWSCGPIPLLLGQNVLTVRAADATANEGTDTLTVTATFLPPPVISQVRSAPGIAGSAMITWTTDVPSSGTVHFGDSMDYPFRKSDFPSENTSHAVSISGLGSSSTQHYRIVAQRNSGAPESTTGDFTFSTFSMPNLGSNAYITDGLGTTLSGFGRIRPGTTSTTPSGVAIFAYRQDGILVSEAGVPDSPTISSGRTYAEVASGGAVNTGLAFANPNTVPVRMFFDLRDKNGSIVKSGFRDFAPGEHFAGFLNEQPYLSDLDFQGSFSFTSTLPVSVIALRGFRNERAPSEFLMSTLPVIDLSQSALSGTQVIPHFAAGGGFTTQIFLVNPTGLAQTGTIEIRGSAGSPTTVNIDGVSSTAASYNLPPNGSVKFVITGASASLASGSVRVLSANGGPTPTPLVLFSYKPAEITVSEATVPVTTGSAFRMYVESSPIYRVNSGIAIANTGGAPGVVTLTVMDSDGLPLASESLPIGPFAQIGGFLDEMIPSLRLESIQGVLRIEATLPVSVVGLRSHYNERSDFLMATTPPTLETALTSSAERFFPQVANGGGFTTQMMLFSGTSGQVANGDLIFQTGNGVPLNLDLRQCCMQIQP